MYFLQGASAGVELKRFAWLGLALLIVGKKWGCSRQSGNKTTGTPHRSKPRLRGRPAIPAGLFLSRRKPTGGLARLSLRDLAITPPGIGSGVPQGAIVIWEWGWFVRRGFGLTGSTRSPFSSLLARRPKPVQALGRAPNFRWDTSGENLEPTGGLEPPTC